MPRPPTEPESLFPDARRRPGWGPEGSRTALAGWAALAFTLAACVLGILLTALRYRDMEGIILDLEKRTAENERARVERFLDETERDILSQLVMAADDRDAVARLASSRPLIAEPFLFRTDGAYVAPSLAAPPLSALVTADAEPEPFARALRLAWGEAPVAVKVQALDEVAKSERIARRWRLRAASTAAALLARSGERKAAADRYAALFADHEQDLLDAARPSYLQLALARGECLAAESGAEARAAILGALEKLRDGKTAAPFAEEEFFAARARRILESTGGAGSPALAAVEERQATRRASQALLETLRDWIFARRRLEPVLSETGAPQHFLEERRAPRRPAGPEGEDGVPGGAAGGAVVFAVWTRLPPPPSGPGLAAVGFRADPERLRSLVESRLRDSGAGDLAVRAGEPAADERFVQLAALSGERRFLRLGLEHDAWKARVGKAREPFIFAGALLVGLAAISVLALLVFLRGMRREVALSRMKTEFVAGVSHELKTPLSLIRLFGETLLLDRATDPEQRKKYCRTIVRESERLAHLISNVLSFATIEAGRKKYDLKPCDLGEVARETYESFRLQLDEGGFSHHLEIAPDLPPVKADADAIAQALLNLMENGMKYSPAEKSLTVRVAAEDRAVKLTVADHGIGIAREDEARIWEDFYRAREARALGTRGSGLGLSLVRHIAEAHGGRVSLVSAPGEGSAFTIALPAAGERR